jgi:aerobic-type carbon monoxide dehydrogenase small subunit (CoxS/CutS family)
MKLTLRVNGADHEVDVPRRATLLSILRDDLGLVATRFGCGQGQCGACFVLADGDAVASCLMTVEQSVDREIVTVEGLAPRHGLSAVQEAFAREGALQCGYCTSGMLISATALLARDPHPSEDEIRDALAPNLCRCGIYGRAIRAVQAAAGAA